MEETSGRYSDTTDPTMLKAKFGNQMPVYDSARTLQQISLVSMSSLDGINGEESLAQALIDLDFEACDSLLAHQPIIESCKNATEHRVDISYLYSKLLDKLMSLYDSVEVVCGQFLGQVISGLVQFAVKRDVEFSQVQLTSVVSKLYESSRTNALELLNTINESKWSDEMHSIRYSMEWEASKKEVKTAETRIQSVSMELEFASKQNDKESVLDQQRKLLECALQKSEKPSQDELRKKHWLSLRIRFEYAWRHFVESKATTSVKEQPLSPEIQSMGSHLLYSIMVLAIHFNEFEYAWYWSERREIEIDFSILVVLMRCCRAAIKTNDKSLWSGRAWVLYKDCLTYDDEKWAEFDFEYVLFMNEFTRFIKENEPVENSIKILPKVYRDMYKQCNSYFFPITDVVLLPLIEICWDQLEQPKAKWQESFNTVMDVYTMYRYMQRMPECTYKDKHYFSASNMIFMLKLCTSNSCLEDFKLLNNELLELEGNDVYAKEVKQGYTAFINFRYDKTRDGSNDNDLFVPTPRLSESALNTLKTLMIREIQNQN